MARVVGGFEVIIQAMGFLCSFFSKPKADCCQRASVEEDLRVF